MHYHILLTERCNSNCRYCYEKSMKEENDLDKKFEFDFSAPTDFSVKIEKLKSFLAKDKNAVLIFYGGEPLLQIDKIKEIIDNINVPFRMQTNGKLLHLLPIKYLNKIDKILISLDGTKERTDFNRGEGTYDLIMDNIALIKKERYNGELIARMTISPQFPDIFQQVQSLINSGFISIHWQIDAGFYKTDFNKKEFESFVVKYNNSISDLIKFWVEEMKKGNILKLYPFLGIIQSLVFSENTLLRCGAGHSGYAITTSGEVIACPIMNCIKNVVAGDLDSNPSNLKKFKIEGKCPNCDYFNLCGGRCLYWNLAELWPKEGDELICKTIKHLIDNLKKILPEINSLIEKGIIKKSDFIYEKYFGPEILP